MSKAKQTFGKKDREKQKHRKRQDKAQRKEDRKANSSKGKGFEDMIAYVDEYGQLSSTPPDPTRTKTVKSDDIQIGIPRQPPGDYADVLRKGTITFFNQSKGYGFIKDQDSHESIFVHINAMEDELKENDKVTFEIGKGAKGPVALKVKNA